MATVGGTVATLMDWSTRLDPDGKTSAIAELLNQRNEVLTDMLWMEGNLATGHRVTQRTGLPNVSYRLLNTGVTPSKSTTAQVDDSCAILEAWSNVDKDLADLNGNTAAFRLSEAKAFVEAMNQQFVRSLFYGNTSVNPERFLGFAPRYGAISGAVNAQNILSGGGSGSVQNSIWLIGWSDDTIAGIFPKGSKAGLEHEDHGLVNVQVAAAGSAVGITSGVMRAYQDRWVWKPGLSVRDWRYAVRICNISTTALTTNASPPDLIALMSRAIDRVPSLKGCRPVFYMNRTVYSFLRLQGLNKSNAAIAVQPGLNQFETGFEGIPIRKVDQLLTTEAQVS